MAPVRSGFSPFVGFILCVGKLKSEVRMDKSHSKVDDAYNNILKLQMLFQNSMSAYSEHLEASERIENYLDLIKVKGKYGLRVSTEEEASEAEMSIAYQRLKSSFEDDKSEAGMKAQKMKEFLMVKDKYDIFGKLS